MDKTTQTLLFVAALIYFATRPAAAAPAVLPGTTGGAPPPAPAPSTTVQEVTNTVDALIQLGTTLANAFGPETPEHPTFTDGGTTYVWNANLGQYIEA